MKWYTALLVAAFLSGRVIPGLADGPADFLYSMQPTNSCLTLRPVVRSGLFRESDSIDIVMTGQRAIRVLDIDRRLVYAGEPKPLRLSRGHYFVETEGDRTQFAVLPDDYQGSPFLGVEADAGNNQPNTDRLAQIQPTWVRAHGGGAGIYWNEVQPQPTVWNWTLADRTIAANAGRKIVWSAFIRPDWQTDDSRFIADFTEYVRRVAERYGDRLYAIEIWNEPAWGVGGHISRLPGTNNTYFTQFYVQLLASAHAVIKAANPHLKVFGPAFVGFDDGYVQTARRLAEAGAGRYLDGFTWHDYGISNGWKVDEDTHFTNNPRWGNLVVPKLETRVAAYRALFPQQELQVNEVGFSGASALGLPTDQADFYSGTTWRRGMNRAIKYAVIGQAAGLTGIVPHVLAGETWTTRNFEVYGWEFRGRGPHPKTSAFLFTCHWLRNAVFVEKQVVDKSVFLYAWRQTNGAPLIWAWCAEGTTRPLRAVPDVTITDVFGRPLTMETLGEDPLLFHGKPGADIPTLLATVHTALSSHSNQ